MKKEKPQAVFIVGFNNWGKTSIIRELFDRNNFRENQLYKTATEPQIEFVVQPESNDDIINGQNWINDVKRRIGAKTDANLLTALCPTYELKKSNELENNFIQLLNQSVFKNYAKFHLFLIEYKYDRHAKLMVDEIKNASQQIGKINIIVINDDRKIANQEVASQNIYDARLDLQVMQIKTELSKIFTPNHN